MVNIYSPLNWQFTSKTDGISTVATASIAAQRYYLQSPPLDSALITRNATLIEFDDVYSIPKKLKLYNVFDYENHTDSLSEYRHLNHTVRLAPMCNQGFPNLLQDSNIQSALTGFGYLDLPSLLSLPVFVKCDILIVNEDAFGEGAVKSLEAWLHVIELEAAQRWTWQDRLPLNRNYNALLTLL
jgi:hypothetical protein